MPKIKLEDLSLADLEMLSRRFGFTEMAARSWISNVQAYKQHQGKFSFHDTPSQDANIEQAEKDAKEALHKAGQVEIEIRKKISNIEFT